MPRPPSEQEKITHELTHIAAKLGCQQRIRGEAVMSPHWAALPQDKDKGPPDVAIDFMHLKTDCTVSDDQENTWATTLVIADGHQILHRGGSGEEGLRQ